MKEKVGWRDEAKEAVPVLVGNEAPLRTLLKMLWGVDTAERLLAMPKEGRSAV
jgi:hypothetical protein